MRGRDGIEGNNEWFVRERKRVELRKRERGEQINDRKGSLQNRRVVLSFLESNSSLNIITKIENRLHQSETGKTQ